MRIRLWNPESDAPGQLAELFNEYYGTALFGVSHFERLHPEGTIVAEDNGSLVACALLLDAGPYGFLDEVVCRSRYRRHAVLRDILRYAEYLCRSRNIPWFNGVLGMSGGDAEKFLSFLKRRDDFPTQYLGERPMYCRRLS